MKLRQLTKYNCKNCNCSIIYTNSYKRYFCSECCFKHYKTNICLICNKQFIGKTKNSKFCADCVYIPSGVSRHPLHNLYKTILYRCYNKDRNMHEFYYDKNITVSKDWLNFNNFIKDMWPRPKGRTIDRIDSTKGYSKENCRWVSINEQRINRNRFKNTSKKYKGVFKYRNKWKAEITLNSTHIYLGLYDTEIEAAKAYDNKVKLAYPKTYKTYINLKGDHEGR